MDKMYLFVAYSIGLIDLVAGLICIFRASKLKPNTYLGFRIPAAFLSQKIWSRINTLSGILGTINFTVIIILSLFIQSIYLVVYAILSTMLIISALSIYSKRIIEIETGREMGGEHPVEVLPTISVSKSRILLGWVITIVLLAIISVTISQMPDTLAVHFDARGHPNFFMRRDEYIISFISITLGGMIMVTSVLYSIKDMPSLKEFEAYNRSLVSILQLVLIIIPLLYTYVYITIYLHNVPGITIPIIIDVVVVLAIITALILFAIRPYWPRKTSIKK